MATVRCVPDYAAVMSPPGRTSRQGQGKPSSDDAGVAALTGGGPSQLGVDGSMRARDVSRPRDEDIAEAEKLVQVSYRPRSRPAGSS